MRECLGWVTNCTDEKRCPQNWLEVAATELPSNILCHVCAAEVQLVATEAEFVACSAIQSPVAFPVVPCAGLPATYSDRYVSHAWENSSSDAGHLSGPQNGALQNGAAKSARFGDASAKILYCIRQTGETLKLDKDTIVIGRSRTCDIIIPSAKVSRQHASIARVDGDYFIEDLGSANGIWRAGERLSGRTKIEHGDVFTISEETLNFELR